MASLAGRTYVGDVSSMYMSKYPDDVPLVLELTEALFGFDSAVIAGQAKLTLVRMDAAGTSDPYHALFNIVKAHYKHNCENVVNINGAMSLLGRMTSCGKAILGTLPRLYGRRR